MNKNLGIYLTLAMLGGGGGLLVGHYIAGRLAEEQFQFEEMAPAVGEKDELKYLKNRDDNQKRECQTILKRENYISEDEVPVGKIRYDQVSDDKPNIEDVVIGSARIEPIRVINEEAYSTEQPKWNYVDLKYLERDDTVVMAVDGGKDVYLEDVDLDLAIGDDALMSFGLDKNEDPNVVYVINDHAQTVYRITRTKRALKDIYADAEKTKRRSEKEAEDAFYDESELADGGINGRG